MGKNKGIASGQGESSRGTRQKVLAYRERARALDRGTPTRQRTKSRGSPSEAQSSSPAPPLPPPPVSRCPTKYTGRKLIRERKIDRGCLTPYNLEPLFAEIGWLPILDFGGPCQLEQMHNFLAACHSPVSDPPSFMVSLDGDDAFITPATLADILHLQMAPEGLPNLNLDLPDVRSIVTKYLCNNRDIPWHQGNALKSRYMEPRFQVMHEIFTTNLYPRSTNRLDLTSLMVMIVYFVAKGTKVCLPTLIVNQLVNAIHTSRDLHLPYPWIISRICQRIGFPSTADPVLPIQIFNAKDIRKIDLVFHEYKEETEEEIQAEHGGGEGGDPMEGTAMTEDAPPGPDPAPSTSSAGYRKRFKLDRIGAIQQDIHSVKERLTVLERMIQGVQSTVQQLVDLMTCRRDDTMPSHSAP